MNALLQVLQMITRSLIADKIASWLHHDLTLCELVDWAENALLREDFAENDASELAAIVGRLGAAVPTAVGVSVLQTCSSTAPLRMNSPITS
jgi:hypothetical protein